MRHAPEPFAVDGWLPAPASKDAGETAASQRVLGASAVRSRAGARGKAARRVLVVCGLALGAAVMAPSLSWRLNSASVEASDDAYVRAEVTAISPKVEGYVSALLVADNEHVTTGQILLRIDDADFRAKVAQAQANVAAAQAGISAQQAAIANLDSQTRQQRNVIGQAEAAVASAEAEVERSQLDQRRYEALAKTFDTPRQRLEAATADLRKATAALAGAQAAAAAERGRLDVLASSREQAQASLQQARATLGQAEAGRTLAQIDLANTVLRAPVDGVGARSVRLGALVQPGTPLLSLVPLDRVWIEANFKETQVARMRAGQAVTIRTDSFPGVAIAGHLDSFSPASGAQFALLPPDNATGNFVKIVQRIPIKITVDPMSPLQGRLRPGMSATVDIDVGGHVAAGAPSVAQADRP